MNIGKVCKHLKCICYRLNYVPQVYMLKSQPPVLQNVILFGEMIFIEIKKFKMRSFGCSNPIGLVFLQKGQIWIQICTKGRQCQGT